MIRMIGILKLVVFILASNLYFAQQYRQPQNFNPLPDGLTMNSLQFINSSTGWVVCSDGYILKTTDEGIKWELISTGTKSFLRSVSFIDSQTGWVVGNNNTLLKTNDGGNTWISLSTELPTNTALGYVKFFNSQIGYIIGGHEIDGQPIHFTSSDNGVSWKTNVNNEKISFDTTYYNDNKELVGILLDYTTYELMEFKSLDNGKNWTVKKEISDDWIKEKLYETQSEIKVASTNFNNIIPICLKTTDGGETWVEKNGLSSGPAFFSDENIGWIISGGDVYKTEDSGENWVKVFDSAGLTKLFFLDNENGWAGGIRYAEHGRTTNGGRTWEEFNNEGGDINALFYFSPNEGWLAASNHNAPFNSIYKKSYDGGLNYNSHFSPFYTTIKHVYYTSLNSGWALAENGKLMKTDSNGDFKIFPFFGNKTTIRSIHFIDKQVGWCLDSESDNWWIEGYSNIWKTTNGGKQWFLSKEKLTSYGTKIFFYNEKIGWNNSGKLGLDKTSDGGTSWHFITSDWHFDSFLFINEFKGWGVGYNQNGDNSIIKTTNGGTDWIRQSYEVLSALSDIKFLDDQNGFVVGNNGTILKTTNGGDDWILQPSGTTKNLNSVFIINSNKVYVVGDDGLILKTTNGGNTWIMQKSGTISNLNNISFVNKFIGWIVGNTGTVLYSKDGGFTWTEIETGTKNNLFVINVTDSNNIWIGGEKGTFLKLYSDLTATYIPNKVVDGEVIDSNNHYSNKTQTEVSFESIPDSYELFQNYPNPFNPSTTIEFTIPEDVKNVSLIIYNILGEKITELINGTLTPGHYKYKWDATNFVSGLYIYELKTDKFSVTKKMMLLK